MTEPADTQPDAETTRGAVQDHASPVRSVWLTGQQPGRLQRAGRYVPDTERHPARMLPDLAAHAITAYTRPGDLVLDPMCGAGTTLVEAVRAGRDAIGVDIEPAYAELTAANLNHTNRIAVPGQRLGRGYVITGDATDLTRLLPNSVRGQVALVLTSPPYGPYTHGQIHRPPGGGIHKYDHRYGHHTPGNLAYANPATFLDGFGLIAAHCARLLWPGGFLLITARPVRRAADDLEDLPGRLLTAAIAAGLEPVTRHAALLAGIRDGRLVNRMTLFGFIALRRAHRDGIPAAGIAHEDALVLRKPYRADDYPADKRPGGPCHQVPSPHPAGIPQRTPANQADGRDPTDGT